MLVIAALLPVLLAAPALADKLQVLPLGGLHARMPQAFIPSTTPIFGGCSQIPGGVECGTEYCYTPSEGQVCCHNEYGCPDGSFCLIDGYCCPDGEDPETCAARNGVTLPAGFVTDATAPVAQSTTPTAIASTTTPELLISTTPSSLPVATLPTTSYNVSILATTASFPSATIVPFTGAANVKNVAGGSIAVLMVVLEMVNALF
ncbi:hypothetical protein MMC24_002266 [Lignoscripta atroalba]|nr:hypothetical protein [Lignoscripta atroalba]